MDAKAKYHACLVPEPEIAKSLCTCLVIREIIWGHVGVTANGKWNGKYHTCMYYVYIYIWVHTGKQDVWTAIPVRGEKLKSLILKLLLPKRYADL